MVDVDILSPLIQTPLTIIGTLLIVFGILQQSENFIKWGASWSDILRRGRTEVTRDYIHSQKIIGVACIAIGAILLIASFNIPKLVN